MLSFSTYGHPGLWQVSFVVLTERSGVQHYAYARDLIKAGGRASFLVRDKGIDREPPKVFGFEVLAPVAETQTHLLANERAVDMCVGPELAECGSDIAVL